MSLEVEALTVAMAVVPGLYSRNRFFTLFADPEVRRARARAVRLRGIVRQLGGAQGKVCGVVLSRGEGERDCEIRYRVESVRLARRVALTPLEASCLAYLASRVGISGLDASPDDRARVDEALRKLAIGLHLSNVEAGDAAG